MAAGPIVHRGTIVWLWEPYSDEVVYDPSTGEWTSVRIPFDSRSGAVAASAGDWLIAWAGRFASTPRKPISGGMRRDRDGLWTPMATKRQLSTRQHAISTWTGRELLLWGGSRISGSVIAESFTDGAAYDPATDTWRRFSKTNAPTTATPTCAWSGTEWWMWSDGGRAYDPAQDRWRELAPLPVDGAVACAKGVAVLVRTDATWRYEPQADLWEPCAPPPDAESARLVPSDRILAIAGNSVREYSIAKDAWVVHGTIPFPEASWLSHVVAYVDGALYTFEPSRVVHRLALT